MIIAAKDHMTSFNWSKSIAYKFINYLNKLPYADSQSLKLQFTVVLTKCLIKSKKCSDILKVWSDITTMYANLHYFVTNDKIVKYIMEFEAH